jgi:hypothetical protein
MENRSTQASDQVLSLARHILSLNPAKDAARLCFQQYLNNLAPAQSRITADLLNRFFKRALSFSHWQANKAELFREVGQILAHFQETTGLTLQLAGMLEPQDIQVVPVENMKSLEVIVTRHIEQTLGALEQFRLLREGEDKLIAITMKQDQSLTISTYTKIAHLMNGELRPLTDDFTLNYTPHLQLAPGHIQEIEVGPHTAARFHESQDGIRGLIVRGYTFQKYAVMEGGSLNRHPVLFYPLKRLEQFFINRKTDPAYMELTSLLEKAIDMLKLHSGERETEIFARAALERGRLALEYIYREDRMIRLLLDNIEKSLLLTEAQPRSEVRTHGTQHHHVNPPGEMSSFDLANLSNDLTESPLEPKDESWPEIRNLPV